MLITSIRTDIVSCDASLKSCVAPRNLQLSVGGRSLIWSRSGVQCSLQALRSPSMGSRGNSLFKCNAIIPPSDGNAVDFNKVSEFITTQSLNDEQSYKMQRLCSVLGVPLATVKLMVYKRRGLLNMEPEEVESKIATIAEIVDVSKDVARQMVVIQPGLLFDTETQARALKGGIAAICYELGAPREEVLSLILENQSVLHGRQMHLSAADIAHLAMLRMPKQRIVD